MKWLLWFPHCARCLFPSRNICVNNCRRLLIKVGVAFNLAKHYNPHWRCNMHAYTIIFMITHARMCLNHTSQTRLGHDRLSTHGAWSLTSSEFLIESNDWRHPWSLVLFNIISSLFISKHFMQNAHHHNHAMFLLF